MMNSAISKTLPTTFSSFTIISFIISVSILHRLLVGLKARTVPLLTLGNLVGLLNRPNIKSPKTLNLSSTKPQRQSLPSTKPQRQSLPSTKHQMMTPKPHQPKAINPLKITMIKPPRNTQISLPAFKAQTNWSKGIYSRTKPLSFGPKTLVVSRGSSIF
jgi:hypothetical protein